jgi:hypothetical protein
MSSPLHASAAVLYERKNARIPNPNPSLAPYGRHAAATNIDGVLRA